MEIVLKIELPPEIIKLFERLIIAVEDIKPNTIYYPSYPPKTPMWPGVNVMWQTAPFATNTPDVEQVAPSPMDSLNTEQY